MWKRDETVTPREGHRDLAAEAAAVGSRTAEKVIMAWHRLYLTGRPSFFLHTGKGRCGRRRRTGSRSVVPSAQRCRSASQFVPSAPTCSRSLRQRWPSRRTGPARRMAGCAPRRDLTSFAGALVVGG
jgi:hypothetical protein